jgi:hypothetical protein
MIPVLEGKRMACGKLTDNFLQFAQVLATFAHLSDVAGELRSLGNPFHFPQLMNILSNESNSVTPSPLRLFARVFAVSVFGISTAKGNPFRRVIWR